MCIRDRNYTDLYYSSSLSIGLSENETAEPYKTLELTAQNMAINPVLEYGIITHQERNIGYVAYSSFVYRNTTSLLQLNNVFKELKEKGIEELILDLRYNTGGYMLAVKRLCSLIAPEEVVESEEVLIHKRWNDAYQAKYAEMPEQLEEHFDKTVPEASRLNLPRLWVITVSYTHLDVYKRQVSHTPFGRTVSKCASSNNVGFVTSNSRERLHTLRCV